MAALGMAMSSLVVSLNSARLLGSRGRGGGPAMNALLVLLPLSLALLAIAIAVFFWAVDRRPVRRPRHPGARAARGRAADRRGGPAVSVEPALALAALAAGLAGAPHCLAMCGALGAGLCALVAPRPGPEALVVALRLHAGRVLGYALLGVLAGGLGASLAGGLALDPRWPRAAAGALLLLLGLGLLVPRLRLAASPAPLAVAERLMARLARLWPPAASAPRTRVEPPAVRPQRRGPAHRRRRWLSARERRPRHGRLRPRHHARHVPGQPRPAAAAPPVPRSPAQPCRRSSSLPRSVTTGRRHSGRLTPRRRRAARRASRSAGRPEPNLGSGQRGPKQAASGWR
ncbi:MAG: cbb3-type cytochrome oxidase assembly protein CcoS [Xanthomonadales bacterium]|nr:cbb3-type cytochrome oxidase assembly protein CcoS [Xanthomonadales bacterium]